MTERASGHTAVMADRTEPNDSLDYFGTPPWATRALCGEMLNPATLSNCSVWEPACGNGFMSRPLNQYFRSVHASDVHDYGGDQERVCDFLWPHQGPPHINKQGVDWVITNPPFKLAMQFAERALDVATQGVALFVRTQWVESIERYKFFERRPPTWWCVFSERVPLTKGDPKPTGSTATSYSWVVWLNAGPPNQHTQLRWIPPCRKKLEYPSDYELTRPAA